MMNSVSFGSGVQDKSLGTRVQLMKDTANF